MSVQRVFFNYKIWEPRKMANREVSKGVVMIDSHSWAPSLRILKAWQVRIKRKQQIEMKSSG